MESYAKTCLTFPSDRLSALSAIATSFRDCLNSDYIGGMWGCFLPESLLWYQADSDKGISLTPRRICLLSWSWISVNRAAGSTTQHMEGASASQYVAHVHGWQVTMIKDRRALFGEVESVRSEIGHFIRPIVSWSLSEGEGLKYELRFQDGSVHVTEDWLNFKLEEIVTPGEPIFFL